MAGPPFSTGLTPSTIYTTCTMCTQHICIYNYTTPHWEPVEARVTCTAHACVICTCLSEYSKRYGHHIEFSIKHYSYYIIMQYICHIYSTLGRSIAIIVWKYIIKLWGIQECRRVGPMSVLGRVYFSGTGPSYYRCNAPNVNTLALFWQEEAEWKSLIDASWVRQTDEIGSNSDACTA